MVFAPGPIFTNILLADEINRTPPKTQSALLEAMQEHRVTIQGRTYTLEEPFFVFATQNPIELEGTYPLPEAQLDRFMFHIVIEHPPEDEEYEVVRTTTAILEPQFERTVNGEDLIAFKRLVRRVPVAEPVMRYALSLVRASRPEVARRARHGAASGCRSAPACAPRSTWCWRPRPGRSRSGRYHVTFDDIRALAAPGAAPPRAHQLPRPVGGHDLGHDRRQAARVGAGAALGDVMQLGGAIPGAQFVDPAVLARIGNLELVARSVVDGVINGLHRSPFFGTLGRLRRAPRLRARRRHPPRRLARLRAHRQVLREGVRGRLELQLHGAARRLGVDGLRRAASRKLDYAKTLGACLTYLVHQQRDRVGLVTFDSDIVDHVPPSAKHLDVVLHTLDRAKATRPGQLSAPLRKLAEHFGRRGVVVLISDLYDEPEAIFEALAPIRFRGSDVVVFHVLDPAELEFPFTDPSAFEDLESGEQLPVVPESFRDKYQALVRGAHRRRSPPRPPSAASTTACSTRPSRSTSRSTTTCRSASASVRVR